MSSGDALIVGDTFGHGHIPDVLVVGRAVAYHEGLVHRLRERDQYLQAGLAVVGDHGFAVAEDLVAVALADIDVADADGLAVAAFDVLGQNAHRRGAEHASDGESENEGRIGMLHGVDLRCDDGLCHRIRQDVGLASSRVDTSFRRYSLCYSLPSD